MHQEQLHQASNQDLLHLDLNKEHQDLELLEQLHLEHSQDPVHLNKDNQDL